MNRYAWAGFGIVTVLLLAGCAAGTVDATAPTTTAATVTTVTMATTTTTTTPQVATTTEPTTTEQTLSDTEVFKLAAIATYEAVNGEPAQLMPTIMADDLYDLGVNSVDNMWGSFDPDLDQCVQFRILVDTLADNADSQTGFESETLFWFTVGYMDGELESASMLALLADVC